MSEGRRKVTVSTLARMKRDGEKIAMLTAYDASFAAILERAGADAVMVGDSLGMVVQGHDSTIPVTLDQMVYHSRLVARGCSLPLIIADLPFASYATIEQAVASAARLMQEGLAHMVKLEGGAVVETVRALARTGIPVCAHLGLLPQSIHKLGAYRVQGREQTAAGALLEDALQLQEAGADVLVLECVPATLGGQVAGALDIPVIGIGAGPDCDGQVLVLYDMLGLTQGRRPRFSRDFLGEGRSVADAVSAYVGAVKGGAFPGPEHCL